MTSTVVWQPDLPLYMSAPDFRSSPGDARMPTLMEVGPSKSRRRVSAALRPISGTIRCTLAQRLRVDEFWNDDTSGGVRPFLFPDQLFTGTFQPVVDGDEVDDTEAGILLVNGWWLVKFISPPESIPRQRSAAFTVSLALSVFP